MSTLYLVPTPIAEGSSTDLVVCEVIAGCDYFVVENIRTARRYISSLRLGREIDSLEFVELSEHTASEQVDSILRPIIGGRCACLMSEAGLPCVADPGNLLVAAAHRSGVEVRPLVGASSIMLALMSSGASGQNFAFNGYLPIKSDERLRAIKFFERRAVSERQTQIFIETPYRNDSLLDDIIKHCDSALMLSVSVDLLSPNQRIVSRSIAQWRSGERDSLKKRPAIFIFFVQ